MSTIFQKKFLLFSPPKSILFLSFPCIFVYIHFNTSLVDFPDFIKIILLQQMQEDVLFYMYSTLVTRNTLWPSFSLSPGARNCGALRRCPFRSAGFTAERFQTRSIPSCSYSMQCCRLTVTSCSVGLADAGIKLALPNIKLFSNDKLTRYPFAIFHNSKFHCFMVRICSCLSLCAARRSMVTAAATVIINTIATLAMIQSLMFFPPDHVIFLEVDLPHHLIARIRIVKISKAKLPHWSTRHKFIFVSRFRIFRSKSLISTPLRLWIRVSPAN